MSSVWTFWLVLDAADACPSSQDASFSAIAFVLQPALRSVFYSGGDSGGALLSMAGELWGVVSFGAGAADDIGFQHREALIDQCLATRFAYYVPLAPYAPWIQDALRELDAP